MEWGSTISVLFPRLQQFCPPFSLLQLSLTTKTLNQRYKELPSINYIKFYSQPVVKDFVVLFHAAENVAGQHTDTGVDDSQLIVKTDSFTVDLNFYNLNLTGFFEIKGDVTISNGKIICNDRTIYLVDRPVRFETFFFEVGV
eukprot:TRINITY_DN19799_c0_g3_i1.p2 TRINITY_DN19799_c0_g3~~TRINITY_DN19799_c0_g3_i1.p2  ORF type:complete len:142 (+),score=16.08 TRINITY_DN19799_c0_g3_i1:122-547(+)